MVSYYAPPLIGGGINRCFCLTSVCLTSVCLSRTSGVTREQRGLGRLKLAHTGLRHHFQGQKVKGQSHQATLVGCTGRPIWTYSNGDLSLCVHDVYRVTACQKVKGHQGALLTAVLGGCSGGRKNVLAVGNCCYVAVCSAVQAASATRGRRGVGHIVAAARLQFVSL